MFANWLRAAFASGRITTKYPRSGESLKVSHENWQTVARMIAPWDPSLGSCIDLCPTAAISADEEGTVKLDAGACIGCGRCVEQYPLTFAWTDTIDMVGKVKENLVFDGGEAK